MKSFSRFSLLAVLILHRVLAPSDGLFSQYSGELAQSPGVKNGFHPDGHEQGTEGAALRRTTFSNLFGRPVPPANITEMISFHGTSQRGREATPIRKRATGERRRDSKVRIL